MKRPRFFRKSDSSNQDRPQQKSSFWGGGKRRLQNPDPGQDGYQTVTRQARMTETNGSPIGLALSLSNVSGMTKRGAGMTKLFAGLISWIINSVKFLITRKLTRISLKVSWTVFKHTLWHFTSFSLLLMLYLLDTQVLKKLFSFRFLQKNLVQKLQIPWFGFYNHAVKLLDKNKERSISRLDLIEMSIRNMQTKRVRSMITIGGMAIGIGAIVFLVSIGYGLQSLVISRVARLEEMRQVDITPQTGGKVKINDKTLADFKDIPSVEATLPLIAVVGRVNYQNSVSDMAVYGVTTDYLKQSAIKPVEGKIFDSNELAMEVPGSNSQVLGTSSDSGQDGYQTVTRQARMTGTVGEKIQDVDFSINPSSWIRVRENPSTSAKILGYTKRVEGISSGEKVWGSSYESADDAGKSGETEDGKSLGKWIKAPVLLWKQEKCDPQTSGDCENGKYMVMRDEDNRQVQKTGYFAQVNVKVSAFVAKKSQVLGVTSSQTATSGASLDWVEIASESGTVKPPDTKTVEIGQSAKKQAVVNRAMLKVLGIKEKEAVGKVFSASFVVVGDLLSNQKERIESAQADYTIVGVTPDEKTAVFYVPFVDLRSLGIANFSQVKIVVKDTNALSKTRKQIEAMGYVTRSVADTVAQISSLFATARTILALLGMVALFVAALGMFNTLTVSLLERTREVGLMKAMGMRSSEVQELFLTESMIMGFFGGILGIIVGFLAGKLVSVVLSVFAVVKGVGFVDVSFIPLSFIVAVVFLSLVVGVATGIYPAKRATKISALNALRYE